jgi:hypothetical protein
MNIPLLGWTDGNHVEMDMEAYKALRPLPTPEELLQNDFAGWLKRAKWDKEAMSRRIQRDRN